MKAYLDDLFVHRMELDQILTWVRKNPGSDREPILSLVSPPGTGKSWLMKAALKRIDDPELIVLDLNIPDNQKGGELDVGEIKGWIRDAYSKARELGIDLTFNQNTHITHSIDFLVEAIEKRGLLLLMIQDGYDEVGEEVRRNLDAWVSWHFIHRPCAKILTGYRTGCRLEDGRLRLHEEQILLLLPDKSLFGINQFQKIFLNKHGMFPTNEWINRCEEWMQVLEHYQWDHPYINDVLFRYAQDNGKLSVLEEHHFCECIESTVARPDKGAFHSPLLPIEFTILRNVAEELNRTWLMSDYETTFGVNGGHQDVDPLLDKGVIEYVRNTQRYQIVPGIYELLLEIRDSPRKR